MLLQLLIGVQLMLNLSFSVDQSFKLEERNIKIQAMNESQNPGGDDLATMMQRYTAYNHWANQQFADWLRSASEEDLNKEIESSFTSLKKTIIHIWNAEYLWLQTVKEESADNSPAKNFDGTKDELLDGWLQASENFSNYVKSMSIEDLQAKRTRSQREGFTVVVDMIHHCMNHSTYHRGQLITMGRQAGLQDPPRTDFIYYVSLMQE